MSITCAWPFPGESVRVLPSPDPGAPVRDIAAALGRADLPLRRHYHDEADARRWFAALRAYPADPWTRKPYPMRFRFRTRLFGPPYLFDGAPHVLVYDDAREYEEIDRLTDLFTEDQRLRARRIDAEESPAEAWERNAAFREGVVRAALPDLSSSSLREAVWRVHGREATGFKQSFAISVLRRLGARRVLDISAGWGDRLIAAIAAGVGATSRPIRTRRFGAGTTPLSRRFGVGEADLRCRFATSPLRMRAWRGSPSTRSSPRRRFSTSRRTSRAAPRSRSIASQIWSLG